VLAKLGSQLLFSNALDASGFALAAIPRWGMRPARFKARRNTPYPGRYQSPIIDLRRDSRCVILFGASNPKAPESPNAN
jgi:hypothetical protein